jgi:hypothetical protein
LGHGQISQDPLSPELSLLTSFPLLSENSLLSVHTCLPLAEDARGPTPVAKLRLRSTAEPIVDEDISALGT